VDAGADLRAILTEMAQAGNHFAGANPLRLRRLLRDDAELAGHVRDARLLDPWIWTTAHEKLFFVFALEISRSDP
jgi:hypothetical protein